MKILIIGDGYLGNRIKNEIFPTATIVKTQDEVTKQLPNFDCLINAAAKTNIDWCEKNKIECYLSNTQLAADLADMCQEKGKRYVFISSACIFESLSVDDWKSEDSWPNPGCFYSLTKWMAEEIVRSLNPFSVIVRIRLPLSSKPGPRNTITKILSYPYLNDAQESVTIIEDMLPELKKLVLDTSQTGTFHLINLGTVSPIEIAEAFGHKFQRTTKAEQDRRMHWEGRARRVTTKVLSTRLPYLPDVRERLPQLAADYKANIV